MNYPLTTSGQVHAAASLAEAVADRYGCVGVISRGAGGTAALLDQTERELFLRRIRCVRVQGAPGGLSSRDLIAQVVGRPDPDALTDADLRAGFMTLTEPGEGFRRVALLVGEAHSLWPSALRYVQLARQATPAKLCVVLAGQPGLVTVLAGEEFSPLRSAMHMMQLSEPARPGLFDKASAVPKPPAARQGSASPLARLGLAAAIVPLVGLIWWRHLPPVPAASAPPQVTPSVAAVPGAPSGPDAAGTSSVPSAFEPPAAAPAAPPPAADAVERPREPAPPEPVLPEPVAPEPAPVTPSQAEADLHAADPAPPVATATAPEPPAPETPPAPEASPPEASAESSVEAVPPAVPEQPAMEPPVAVAEPLAAPSERSEGTTEETVAEPSAPKPAAPDVSPSTPEPAIAAKPLALPQPHGTLTVTAAPPAHTGVRRATAPVAVPQAAVPPARPAEERPNLADERRCREIVLKAQLGKDPSDADKQFLRSGCRSS